MARRVFQEEPESHERWLVSYADLITLLFAFFVVMYAVSSVNEGKYRELTAALDSAFSGAPKPAASAAAATADTVNAALPPGLQQQWLRQHEAMQRMASDLTGALAGLIADGRINISRSPAGLRIDIYESLLFASGSAAIAGAAVEAVNRIASRLAPTAYAIQVEGHTDDTPIHNAQFQSNWELSAVRASSVVRHLAARGIAPARLSAVGYGDTQPIGDNRTEAGRGKNRRISIMVLLNAPQAAASEVPAP